MVVLTGAGRHAIDKMVNRLIMAASYAVPGKRKVSYMTIQRFKGSLTLDKIRLASFLFFNFVATTV